MRILIAHNHYRQAGGEDAVVKSEYNLLKSQGHEVRIYERSNTEINSFSLGQKINFLFEMNWSRHSYLEMKRIIEEFHPDIVHFHNIFYIFTPSVYLACKEAGVPVVQSQHNFRLFCANGLFYRNNRVCEECVERSSLWRGVLHKCSYRSRLITALVVRVIDHHWRNKTWMNMVDCFITGSEFSRQKFIQAGIPADKVRVKPNFIEPPSDSQSARKNFALYVGRLSKEKGVDVLLRAWKDIPDFTLKIIGDGPLTGQLKAYVENNKMTNVEILGFVNQKQYEENMKNAKFLVVPSQCYENFPRIVVEGLSYGIPILASRLGSLQEIIQDKETGLLFDPSDMKDLIDKANEMIQAKHDLSQMSRAGQKVFKEKYLPQKNYERLMDIYQTATETSEKHLALDEVVQRDIQKAKAYLSFAEGFKRYTKNTGYLLFEKVARVVVSIAVWAFVARYLGVEQFGLFNFALSFVFLFKIISDLGLDDVIVRDLVKNEKKKDEILGTSFLLKFCGASLAIVLIPIVTGLLAIEPFSRTLIFIMAFRLLFQSFYNIDFYFQSRVLSKYVVYSQLMALTITSILCLTFIYLKMPLVYFVYVVVIEALVTSLGLNFFYALKHQGIARWKFNLQRARNLFKDTWPLIISGVSISIYMRMDQIMLKQMLNATFVGYYAAAVRVSEVFYFLPIIITGSLFPAIVNAKLAGESLYYNRLQALFSILFWPAIGLSLVFTLAAKPIILFLYGQEYLPAVSVLSIHIWACVFIFIGYGRYKWTINENLQIYTMFYTIIGAITNVVLNLILIPIIDIRGAAIATVVSQFVAAVLSSLFSKKTSRIFFLQLKSMNLFRSLNNSIMMGKRANF